jgi:hypothetical protein
MSTVLAVVFYVLMYGILSIAKIAYVSSLIQKAKHPWYGHAIYWLVWLGIAVPGTMMLIQDVS